MGSNPASWVRIPPRPFKAAVFRRSSRGVAQSGRALRSGRRGPRFKSGRPDWSFEVPRGFSACEDRLIDRQHDSLRPPSPPGGGGASVLLERWQNGIALASKASARKGLGVRIPRAPLRTEDGPSGQVIRGAFSCLWVAKTPSGPRLLAFPRLGESGASMREWLRIALWSVASALKSQRELALENVALRRAFSGPSFQHESQQSP